MRAIVILLCRVGPCHCALPLTHVVETCDPLPVRPSPGMPGFISGVSLVRGMPLPVINAALLVGAGKGVPPTRFVTLQIAERQVILAVEKVVGIRAMPADPFDTLPPLLGAARSEIVREISAHDSALLWLLDTVRIVPASVWHTVEADEVPA